MNLVEQLGWYEECKRIRDIPAASSFRVRDIEFTREELEAAMLGYRRAHTIFEVGDKVQYDLVGNSFSDIFEIVEISDGNIYFEHVDGESIHGGWIGEDALECIKHAEELPR